MGEPLKNENVVVSEFVDQLDEPIKEIVSGLRQKILASNEEITEQIKWKAPSFCFRGEDRVTFRLNPKDGGIQLIFHRGAKVKDASDFVFEDSSGLFEWAAPDRAIVEVKDPADADAKSSALVKVINEWMKATA